jgi:hypothetical protein
MFFASALVVWVAISGVVCAPVPARAGPGNCPPFCDGIPDSAWIAAPDLPLHGVYRWPGLAGLAASAPSPRFRFEQTCASPPVGADPRTYAVAAVARVPQPSGQWQLQVQVLHWRGDAWQTGQTADSVLQTALGALQACTTTPATITTDRPGRVAAVINTPGKQVLHEYLLADASSGTVVELAMWAASPQAVPWRAAPDPAVLDAMAAPLCAAYAGSCR